MWVLAFVGIKLHEQARVQHVSTRAIHWILWYPACSETGRNSVFCILSSRWGHSPSTAPLAETELFGCDVEFFTFSFFVVISATATGLSNCNSRLNLQGLWLEGYHLPQLYTTEPFEEDKWIDWILVANVLCKSSSTFWPDVSPFLSYNNCLKASFSMRTIIFFRK